MQKEWVLENEGGEAEKEVETQTEVPKAKADDAMIEQGGHPHHRLPRKADEKAL